jgi:Zn-dependent protease
MEAVFQITILIMSVVIHEVSHGYAALMQGDHTAEYAGRLTLNPLKHLDPVGSFIVPLVCYVIGAPVFGWAIPVPFNPYNLKNRRWGEALVAIAGPVSNLLIALIFGFLIRFFGSSMTASFLQISVVIVLVNLLLAVFNMIPVPPLDGSKILFSILPYRLSNIRVTMERYSLFLGLIVIFFLWEFFVPIVPILFHLITGLQ